MKIQVLKHEDTIFALPTIWATQIDREITISLSWLVFSLDFAFNNESYE